MTTDNYLTGQAFTANLYSKTLICVKCSDTEFITERLIVHKFSDYDETSYGDVIELDDDLCGSILSYYHYDKQYKVLTEQLNAISDKRIAVSDDMRNLELNCKKSLMQLHFFKEVEQKAREIKGNEEFNTKNQIFKVNVGAVIHKTERPIKCKIGTNKEYEIVSKEQALDLILNDRIIEINAKKDCVYITASC